MSVQILISKKKKNHFHVKNTSEQNPSFLLLKAYLTLGVLLDLYTTSLSNTPGTCMQPGAETSQEASMDILGYS